MTTESNNSNSTSNDTRITYDFQDYICLIGLNRADKRNALIAI